MLRLLSVATSLVLLFLLAGCGDSGDDRGTTATAGGGRTAGPRPALPRQWRRVVNPGAGFSLGLPPGWRARGARGATILRAPDKGIAVSVAADRSSTGRAGDPAQYARATIHALPGFRALRAGRVHPRRGLRLPAAQVGATGTFAASGVRQAIELVAISQRDVATFTLVSFRAARAPATRYAALLAAIERSFHAESPR